MSEKTVRKNDKKLYPLFFLVVICFILYGIFQAWKNWSDNYAANRLEDVERSEDIESLLKGDILFEEINHNNFEELDINSVQDILVYYENMKRQDGFENQENYDFSADFDETALENYNSDVVNLALREIFLVQGQGGLEKWRLMANWATLRDETSILSLNSPILLYNANDDNIGQNQTTQQVLPKEMLFDEILINNTLNKPKLSSDNFYDNSDGLLEIKANNGFIYDENTKLRLIKNVYAQKDANFVKSELLLFDDKTSLINFPNTSEFGGKDIIGAANQLTWDLKKNELLGKGNVEVIWTPE